MRIICGYDRVRTYVYTMSQEENLQAMPDEKKPLLSGRGSVQESSSVEGVNDWLWEVRLPQGSTSSYGAVFIIINAALGAGLLTFPVAFYSAGGIIPAVLVMLFLLIWIATGLLVLAYLAETLQTSTFEEVVGKACGPRVKAIVDACIIVYTFGTCIAFLVVIGDQLQDLSSAVHIRGKAVSGEWWMDRRLLITLSALIFVMPWLWMKNIGVLSYTSALGVLCCGYICLVVAVRFFLPYSEKSCTRTAPPQCSRQWTDFFTAIPFICFGYQCHVSSVPVYAGLKRRSLQAYLPVVFVTLAVCVAVYTITGVFGFLTFNGKVCISPDVLRNYCAQDPAVDVARVMLIIVMITSYPILAFCGRTALDYRIQQLLQRLLPHTIGEQSWWERVRLGSEGTVWLLLSLLLALFVPQISYVINPIGGLAAILMFVFPAMSWLHLTLVRRHSQNVRRLCTACLSSWLLVLGTFIFGTSLVYNLMKDFNAL